MSRDIYHKAKNKKNTSRSLNTSPMDGMEYGFGDSYKVGPKNRSL